MLLEFVERRVCGFSAKYSGGSQSSVSSSYVAAVPAVGRSRRRVGILETGTYINITSDIMHVREREK